MDGTLIQINGAFFVCTAQGLYPLNEKTTRKAHQGAMEYASKVSGNITGNEFHIETVLTRDFSIDSLTIDGNGESLRWKHYK